MPPILPGAQDFDGMIFPRGLKIHLNRCSRLFTPRAPHISIMPSVEIALDISPEQFLAWYEGTARSVLARCHSGKTVQFPASVLQRFVSTDGIRGAFLLTYDENYRFVSITKLKPTSGLDRHI
jgi:hypothetical protein